MANINAGNVIDFRRGGVFKIGPGSARDTILQIVDGTLVISEGETPPVEVISFGDFASNWYKGDPTPCSFELSVRVTTTSLADAGTTLREDFKNSYTNDVLDTKVAEIDFFDDSDAGTTAGQRATFNNVFFRDGAFRIESSAGDSGEHDLVRITGFSKEAAPTWTTFS